MALALGASMLLHAWLAHQAQGVLNSPRANSVDGVLHSVPSVLNVLNVPLPSIRATLSAPTVDLLAAKKTLTVETAFAAGNAPAPMAVAAASSVTAMTAIPATQPAPSAIQQPLTLTAVDNHRNDTALPQPQDATYYGALSLDVYPQALTTLELVGMGVAGQVRATVLIDESGVVNAVRAVDAAQPDIAAATRALLLQTRFTPARKDGRIVKAEVRVSLRYGDP